MRRWSRRYFGPVCEEGVQVGGFLEMWNTLKGGGWCRRMEVPFLRPLFDTACIENKFCFSPVD